MPSLIVCGIPFQSSPFHLYTDSFKNNSICILHIGRNFALDGKNSKINRKF